MSDSMDVSGVDPRLLLDTRAQSSLGSANPAHQLDPTSAEPNAVYASGSDSTFDDSAFEWEWQYPIGHQPYFQSQRGQQQAHQFAQGLGYEVRDHTLEHMKVNTHGLDTQGFPPGGPDMQSMGQHSARVPHSSATLWGAETERQDATEYSVQDVSTPQGTLGASGTRLAHDVGRRPSFDLEQNSDRRQDHGQSTLKGKGPVRASRHRRSAVDDGIAAAVRPSNERPWSRKEERCYRSFLLMDDRTQHARAAKVMSLCGFPERTREDYEKRSRAEQRKLEKAGRAQRSGRPSEDTSRSKLVERECSLEVSSQDHHSDSTAPSPERLDDASRKSPRREIGV